MLYESVPSEGPGQNPFYIDWESAGFLEFGLREIAENFPIRFADSKSGRKLSFQLEEERDGFRIIANKEEIKIHYARRCDAFRGLAAAVDHGSGVVEETCAFASLGVMLDVSRNGVLKVESIKKLFRHFALMGINTVQLYMEDVYVMEGEPFFGYARGAYSKEELRAIDQYGAALGIEVVPCIQTLGHLEQVLQWPAYSDLIDVPGVLLVEEAKTYQLIGKMLDTMVSCFQTKRIHIGMDEAHGVGQGRYRALHGVCKPFDVLNIHLEKVVGLCEKRGLHPMIWSDMYFRMGSASNDYYDPESRIPADVVSKIPTGVELVYWDYYHTNSDFYADMIQRHHALGKKPIFATSGWTWGRFWPHFPHAFSTISAGMKAARDSQLSEAIVTLWGDDGTECNPFAMLLAVQYFAECAYAPDVKTEQLSRRFSSSCGGDMEGFLLGSEVDAIPGIGSLSERFSNFGKWILWHDPLLNFLERHIPEMLPSHYELLAEKLELHPGDGEAAVHLQFITQLARTLSKKSQIHLEVGAFYRKGNIEGLRGLFSQTLPETLELFGVLQELHRTIWNSWRKPFGWDVLERRYAGAISRLESLQRVLGEHINNPNVRIPELEEKGGTLFPPDSESESFFNYARSSCPCA